ncbi:hypothetical protein [Streptomyces sp. NPDC005533]
MFQGELVQVLERPSALGRRGPVLGAAWSTVQRIIADPTRLSAR